MILPRLKKNIKALNWICGRETLKMPKVGTVLKNWSIIVASKYQAIQDCTER